MAERTTVEITAACSLLFTKDRLMACLKMLVHEDVFLAISKEYAPSCSPTQAMNIQEIMEYLNHLMTIPKLRLQSYSKTMGTAKGLLVDIISCSQTPLFCKYTKADIPTEYSFDEFAVVDFKTSQKVVAKQYFVHLLHQNVERIIGEKQAAEFCEKYTVMLKKTYELVSEVHISLVEPDFQNCRTIEEIEEMLKKHHNLFIPYTRGIAGQPIPFLRVFNDDVEDFCFAKDLETAVYVSLAIHYPEKYVPDDWVEEMQIDTEEDRKMGIVRIFNIKAVKRVFKRLKIPWEALSIINIRVQHYRDYYCFPMVSPFFSHCKLAIHAYQEVIDHLVMEMRVFQKVKNQHKERIKPFLHKLNDIFNTSRVYRYVIEQWKVDEITEEADKLMRKILTQAAYNIPLKESFTQSELENEIKKFSPVNTRIKKLVFDHLESKKSVGPNYSYYEVVEALLMGTSHQMRIDKPLATFYLVQNHHSDKAVEDYYSVYADQIFQYEKVKMEKILSHNSKFDKHDLGPVAVPKTKKNLKPDFSKKINKVQTLSKLLKFFNENYEKMRRFEIAELMEHFSEEECAFLGDVLENKEKRSEIENCFEIEVENGNCTLKRKNADHLTSMIIKKFEVEKSLEDKIRNLELALKKKDEELEKEREQKDDAVRQSAEKIEKLKAENKQKIEELSKDLEEAKTKTVIAVENLKTQTSNLKAQTTEMTEKLKAECAVEKANNERLEMELKETREGKKNAEERNVKESDKQLKEATEKLKRMENELADLKAWKTLKEQEIEILKKENGTNDTQIQIAKESGNEEFVRELQGREKEKDDKIEELNVMKEQLESKNQEMENTIRGLKDDIQIAQESGSVELVQELQERENASQEVIQSLLSTNTQLEAENQELKGKLEQLKSMLQ